MRALTLRHPWPLMIALGFKDVENREWDERYAELVGLPGLIGEQIAIHGGAAPVRGKNRAWLEFCEALDYIRELVPAELPDHAGRHFAGRLQRAGRGHLIEEDFIQPGIVAITTISHVTRASQSPWAVPGQLHLLLSATCPLAEPVACPGSRGFWEVPPVVAAEALRQVRAADALRVPVSRTAEEWLA